MKLIERLYDYFEVNGIKPTALEKELGLSNGYFGKQKDRNASIGSHILEKIAYKFPDLDFNNLIAGKPKNTRNYELPPHNSTQKLEETAVQYAAVKKSLPYYDIDTHAGYRKLFYDHSSVAPSAHISIPGFEDCNGYVNVYGDSMEEAYFSGDIIVYKLVADKKIIQYGQPYLVVTGDDIYFRYLKKSSDQNLVALHAHNTFHDAFDISLESIRYLALVKGKIQRNTI